MISEKSSTILLVKIMGMLLRIMPYTSHMITEMVAKVNISSEISAADLVFQVLITCGKNVTDEMHPAFMPNRSMAVMGKNKDVKVGKKQVGSTCCRTANSGCSSSVKNVWASAKSRNSRSLLQLTPYPLQATCFLFSIFSNSHHFGLYGITL